MESITPYHWIALGLILLAAEMLGTAGFLIGAAVAALAMGAVLWLVPGLSVGVQLTIYGLLAISATMIYFRLFRDAQVGQGRPLLNNRAARLIGHQFELQQDIELGTGKVQIGDTVWKVRTEHSIKRGTVVEVVAARRMSLIIAPS